MLSSSVATTSWWLPGGLQIIDVTIPSSPSIVGEVEAIEKVLGVELRDGYAFVADGGLRVIDVMTPAAPVDVGFVETPGILTTDLAVSGNHAYVTDASQRLLVIDISAPTSPMLVAAVELTEGFAETPLSIALSGDHAYVVDGFAAFLVMDVSQPSSPVQVHSSARGWFSIYYHSVTTAGGYVYVPSENSGLFILDECDLAAPLEAQWWLSE